MTEEQLQTKRDALISSIAGAFESLRSGDKSVTYQSVDQMQKALAVIDAEIAAVSGTAPVRVMRFYGRL